MIYVLPVEAVIAINQETVGDLHAVLDRGKLESALARPLQDVFGVAQFPSVNQRAGALLHGLALAHAFMEGNKRTAWDACVTYLGRRGIHLATMSAAESGGFVIDLVEHRANEADAALWLAARELQ